MLSAAKVTSHSSFFTADNTTLLLCSKLQIMNRGAVDVLHCVVAEVEPVHELGDDKMKKAVCYFSV